MGDEEIKKTTNTEVREQWEGENITIESELAYLEQERQQILQDLAGVNLDLEQPGEQDELLLGHRDDLDKKLMTNAQKRAALQRKLRDRAADKPKPD